MRHFFCFFLLLILMFTGCSGLNNTLVSSRGNASNVSSQAELTQLERQQLIFDSADNETKCEKMITRKIDWENERDFQSFATRISRPIYGYIPTVDMIDSAYPIECLRDMGNGRRYAVYFMKGGGRFFFFFYNGNYYHSVYVSKAKYKKDFDDIVIGDSFEKVVAVDRDAWVWEYAFAGDYSTHLLKDGVLFYQYQDGIITDIRYSADFIYSSEEWKYDYSILPQDYPL